MRGSNAGRPLAPASWLEENHTVGQAEIQISHKPGCPAIRLLKIKATSRQVAHPIPVVATPRTRLKN